MFFSYTYIVGTPFQCETMEKYFWKNALQLSLPYDKIKFKLLSNKIITSEEKSRIESQNREEEYRMQAVLSNIHYSLLCNQTRKFKRFLELMEKSDDRLLKKTAEKLG